MMSFESLARLLGLGGEALTDLAYSLLVIAIALGASWLVRALIG